MVMSALGAHRRILGNAREDLVGAVILLEALIDVAEGDERQAVIRIEIEAEAQIDDRRQFVALRVADDAETVEQLGRAVLSGRNDRRQRLAGLEGLDRGADDRMTRQRRRRRSGRAPIASSRRPRFARKRA